MAAPRRRRREGLRWKSSPSATSWGTVSAVALLAMSCAALLSSCSAGESSTAERSSGVTEAAIAASASAIENGAATVVAAAGLSAVKRTPMASAEAAVSALLTAEQADNHRASFALLSPGADPTSTNPEGWARHRRSVGRVASFRIESADGPAITALVERPAALDPFRGLQFAKERQTWRAVRDVDGWLVEPTPLTEPIVPADDGAAAVVLSWASASQSCNDGAAKAAQAVETPFGISATAHGLCGSTSALSIEATTMVAPGPQTAALIEQYGPGIVGHLRSVGVNTGSARFAVLVVPMGERWKVLAVNDL